MIYSCIYFIYLTVFAFIYIKCYVHSVLFGKWLYKYICSSVCSDSEYSGSGKLTLLHTHSYVLYIIDCAMSLDAMGDCLYSFAVFIIHIYYYPSTKRRKLLKMSVLGRGEKKCSRSRRKLRHGIIVMGTSLNVVCQPQ